MLTKAQSDKIKNMIARGDIELLKELAEEQINGLRAGKVRKLTNDDTVWNLAESIGGENALIQFFNHINDISNSNIEG